MNKFLVVLPMTLFAAACAVQSKRPEIQNTAVVKKNTPAVNTTNSKVKNKKVASIATNNNSNKEVTPLEPQQPTPQQKIHTLEEEGKYLEALSELISFSTTTKSSLDAESSRLHAIEVTESKLNEEQLKKVADDTSFSYVRANANFKLATLALENHDKDQARRYYTQVIELAPNTEMATKSQENLSQLEASRNVEVKTIGVVLPLSGKNAPVGQRALRGIEMGLGVTTAGSSFKLAVMDSEGNPDSARRGVERLVKEDNVIAIIGSLLSKTAPAVATKADELGVPTIALSQKSGLTDIGPNVFRNSLTSEMQVRHLVRTAMNDLGLKKFAIMYPNDAYGVEYANIFWDEVLARGGEVTSVQNYSDKETDFRFPVQRLVGTYYTEARAEEFKFRSKEALANEKKKAVRHSISGDDILPPIVDFDAVFIPDSAKALGQISAMLAFNDVRGVKLLGTNLWNTKDIAKRAGNSAGNIVFVDGFIDNNKTAERSRFATDYKTLFNEDPSLIEIQAYDSALILKQLILSGANNRESLTKNLSELKNFPGSVGTLNMSPEREVERPLVAYTIERGELSPLKTNK